MTSFPADCSVPMPLIYEKPSRNSGSPVEPGVFRTASFAGQCVQSVKLLFIVFPHASVGGKRYAL